MNLQALIWLDELLHRLRFDSVPVLWRISQRLCDRVEDALWADDDAGPALHLEHAWVEVLNYGTPTGYWYCLDTACAHGVMAPAPWTWSESGPPPADLDL